MFKGKKMGIKIITLCGSSKFKKVFYSIAEDLTLKGVIVLMPHIFEHADNLILTDEIRKDLDKLHKIKILISHEILIINVNKYIGKSTKSEIEYANLLNKKIKYWR